MTVVDATSVDLDAIDVTDRIRQDVGDITTLAESIAAVGLLNPLVVTPDMRLVAGERRLAALRHLGRKRANVTVLDFDSVAKLAIAERDENTERLPFTREEQIRAAMRIEEALKPAAAERRREGARRGPAVRDGREERSSLQPCREDREKGAVATMAAKAVGMSERTFYQGKAVLTALDEASEDERPVLRAVVDEMNATGSVNGAAQKARELATAKGMPTTSKPGPKAKPGGRKHHEDWHRFDKAWGSFTHACENAVDMPIPDDATPERMESMLRELEGCITGINQLRKRLKEALTA
jgi:ParB-like chromosome segregation protein Spo0J